MNNTERNNNFAFIKGQVITPAEFSHEVFGESFFELSILVERLSGQNDILPAIISQDLITKNNIKLGSTVSALGQFRSHNVFINQKSKLKLKIFIKEIVDCTNSHLAFPNTIILSGYICKQPIYRLTPMSRKICDILVAVNRSFNKSDYIPCICWGKIALFAKDLEIGSKIFLIGRMQSRDYNKKINNSQSIKMTAYEVSVAKMVAFDSYEHVELCNEYGISPIEETIPRSV